MRQGLAVSETPCEFLIAFLIIFLNPFDRCMHLFMIYLRRDVCIFLFHPITSHKLYQQALLLVLLPCKFGLLHSHWSKNGKLASSIYATYLFPFCPGAAASVKGLSLQYDSSISRGLAPHAKTAHQNK